MIEEFRALGGVAENVELKEGRFGRGLFARDPQEPVELFVPASLMFAADEVELAEDGLGLSAKAEADERTRRFWRDYQRDFGWGVGCGHAEHLLTLLQDVPAELRAFLEKPFKLAQWLDGPTQDAILQRYINTRSIGYGGGRYIMPVVELANHGRGQRFVFSEGIRLSGLFPDGEVLAEYALCDPWGMFARWGFASGNQEFGLCLGLGLETKWGRLKIEAGDLNDKLEGEQFIPKVEIVDDTTTKLSFMLLGHKRFPRLARGIFTKVMRDAGHTDTDELFDRIQHINRAQFYKLIAATEELSPELGSLLRAAALSQLEAMSWCFGTRPL